ERGRHAHITPHELRGHLAHGRVPASWLREPADAGRRACDCGRRRSPHPGRPVASSSLLASPRVPPPLWLAPSPSLAALRLAPPLAPSPSLGSLVAPDCANGRRKHCAGRLLSVAVDRARSAA